MTIDFQQTRELLQEFKLTTCSSSNWGGFSSNKAVLMEIESQTYHRQMIAELSGVVVLKLRRLMGRFPMTRLGKQFTKRLLKSGKSANFS